MPEMREYRRFGSRYMLLNALSMLPFIPVFIFIWIRAQAMNLDFWLWIASGIFLAGAVFGLWWQWYRSRRMVCPKCGSFILRKGHVEAGEPLNFVCTRCDIEWVTGLSQSDD
jgi:hypothetical protein